MGSKKIVYIIVEGPTDSEALGVILTRIYEIYNNNVYIEILHGDITSNDEIKPDTIEEQIKNFIEKYANMNYLKCEDFQEIIHLVDTDGIYIPDTEIFLDNQNEKTFYKTSGIYTNDIRKIRTRNNHKKANIERLISINQIWENIPYNCYYMSCNLDHVLHNKANCNEKEKAENAYKFAEKYKENINGFLKFLCKSDFSRCEDFRESWNYIKIGMRSLERNTNFGICFMNIIKTLK